MSESSNNYKFKLGYDDIQKDLISGISYHDDLKGFQSAVTDFLTKKYKDVSGLAKIIFNDTDKTIEVSWSKDAQENVKDVSKSALRYLELRDYKNAIPLLEKLITLEPQNPNHYYNLGMIYSDQSQFGKAETFLMKAATIAPSQANIQVALGVLQVRSGSIDKGIETLTNAIQIDPNNAFAHQNLGASFGKKNDLEKAELHFQKSIVSQPDNFQSMLGLAQVFERTDRSGDADELYERVIKNCGNPDIVGIAKEGRTRISQSNLRKGGAERLDIVMYCLGALEKFKGKPLKEVQAIGYEIATLGMRGLDINDSRQKYSLKTLTGKFSGLHLLSLMYCAFQQIDPKQDVGADFSKEYKEAKSLFESQNK